MDYSHMLDIAVQEARTGLREGGIPIGSALFDASGAVVGTGHNQRVQRADRSAHAEVEAFRNAGRRRSYRDTTISTTLAPCWLCSGLNRQFGISTVVVGESRTFRGGIYWLRECGVHVIDCESDECMALLRSFIAEQPETWGEDIGEWSARRPHFRARDWQERGRRHAGRLLVGLPPFGGGRLLLATAAALEPLDDGATRAALFGALLEEATGDRVAYPAAFACASPPGHGLKVLEPSCSFNFPVRPRRVFPLSLLGMARRRGNKS